MFKTLSLTGAAVAMSATALVPAAPAMAQRGYYNSRGYDRGYQDNGRTYRGENYRSYRARQKCNDGDGGTIVGAIAGGLLGHTVAGRNDRLLGTVLGAGAGALAGRAIDRSDRPGYCRR
ncbi:glycine zipper 2TM domain-containing protein [Sphingomonas oligophenolica]|uniref:17 kDa surface antigen n=1 Tax=Sphingomonas oligophenolica TaxID=301154 RepID=A0A502CLG2_9SPHN|nr:glycine zipper 2TM domain-containing protein [Sphingomonas oligophenolica]TPG13582.1 glycine zipper 2TM domain-containing protein [Sphingomonas oligophenolica]